MNNCMQLLLWNCQINTFTMKEWKLCKCFRAFNKVHGKCPHPPPRKIAPFPTPSPNPNPYLGGHAGENLLLGIFIGGRGRFSDHDGNFTGGNFPVTILTSAFQIKINAASTFKGKPNSQGILNWIILGIALLLQ